MALIPVEVVYALPHEQLKLSLQVPANASVVEVVSQSGLLSSYPEIDLTTAVFGIFGRVCKPDTPVQEGDRVEIYRPLIADPKEARKRRAAQAASQRKSS